MSRDKIERISFSDDVKKIAKYTRQSNCNNVLLILIHGRAPNCIKYVCRRYRVDKENTRFLHESLIYGVLDVPIWLHRHGFKMTCTAYYYACFLKRNYDHYIFENEEKHVVEYAREQCEWIKSTGVDWDTKIFGVLVRMELYRLAMIFVRNPKRAYNKALKNNNVKLMKKLKKKYNLDV